MRGPAGRGSKITVAKQLPGDSYAGGGGRRAHHDRRKRQLPRRRATGRYVVIADAGTSCALMDARVEVGAYSKVDIPCDTGIR